MSNPCRPHLPLEILDYIVDLLHDEPETLGQCCLVSKSWVARTRKYLFASIMFRYPGDLGLWKKTFSDPENSPAYHTRALFVLCPQVFTAADAEEGAWIRMFPHVVRLVWGTIENLYESEVSLAPFRSFSPVLKSLNMVSRNLQSCRFSTSFVPCPFSKTCV